jgi:hypothetical protein
VLAISLLFPSAIAAIFLKENVFNLERLFRTGVHQLLILAVAITFALLVGLAWSQWAPGAKQEWLLWVAIAIVVIFLARPASVLFESRIHRLIQTQVRYPDVNDLFEQSKNLTDFLRALSAHFVSHLNMKFVHFSFFQDPTKPWGPSNEQRWEYHKGHLLRIYDPSVQTLYRSYLYRGDETIGEIRFDGGDALAFDPYSSKDWAICLRHTARCLEILSLREFISIQQSFLAVGRMQSLIAHQMKNPLAIIKVCAGLLTTHVRGVGYSECL